MVAECLSPRAPVMQAFGQQGIVRRVKLARYGVIRGARVLPATALVAIHQFKDFYARSFAFV